MTQRYYEDPSPGTGRGPRAGVPALGRARRCRSTATGRSASRSGPTRRSTSSRADFDDARLGRGCPCRRTGSCTATARRPTRTSSTPSRSTRRACPTRTRPATTGARFDAARRTGATRRRGAALRGRRLLPAGRGSTARSSGTSKGSRLPAEFDVGDAAAARRGERARRARAPVVGRQSTSRTRTCGGCRASSASVTLLARPAGGARRRLRARRLRPRARAPARCGSTPTRRRA